MEIRRKFCILFTVRKTALPEEYVSSVESIGDRIRYRREYLKLSQKQVADALSMSEVGYGHYERNRSELTASQVVRIGRVLRVPASWLLGEEDPDKQVSAIFTGISAERKRIAIAVTQTLLAELERQDELTAPELPVETREVHEDETDRREYALAASSGKVKDPLGPRKESGELLDEARERKKREKEEEK